MYPFQQFVMNGSAAAWLYERKPEGGETAPPAQNGGEASSGDLYVLAAAGGAIPWGYGLFKLDKDSNLLWKYLEQTHHDLNLLDDGRIVTLTHEFP